ncbi:MAG TPA: hypothetical protein DCS24_02995 [Erythrobacter sp.]|nr:hypothetical protein [Erythrobacter sp.]
MPSVRRAFESAVGPAACLSALALAITAPSNAQDGSEASEIKSALAAIQAKDQALQDIGWRLVARNAEFCSRKQVSAGLQLLDLRAFGEPDRIRAALDLGGDFLVQTVAEGSPAYNAALKPDAEVFAIDGKPLSDKPSKDSRDWRRLAEIHDEIDLAMSEAGEVALAMDDGRVVILSGIPVCATRFELDDGGKRAVADGKRVQIGADFPGYGYPEGEFAAAIAHELAHNILGHRIWLDKEGRKRKNIRATEREADRLMPWLLANAGYDPASALRFMQRWGPRHSGGIFRKRTHEGWDERVEQIAAEIERMQQSWAGDGPANWRQHFVREIEAD